MQNTLKKFSITTLATFLFFSGAIFITNFKSAKAVDSNFPKMTISPMEFNAGDISMANGKYTTVYKVKNDGTADLKISKIITSCMCTTAMLKIDGRTSPAFGMPGHNSGGLLWSETIKPGQTGDLEVIFDPLAHGPEATGPIDRTMTITSNDPTNPNINLRFFGNVVKGDGTTNNNQTKKDYSSWFTAAIIIIIGLAIFGAKFYKK